MTDLAQLKAQNLWNVETYSQFLDARTRPARDLLSAIPKSFQPAIAYDLGCGPGNSTILLKARWPNAKVVGIDSSPDMLKQAKLNYEDINFIEADIAHFSPTEKIDLIFANASLQWLDQHEILLPKLAQYLNPQGILAIQMPNNFHSPSHQITIQLLQSELNWQPLLKELRYGLLAAPMYQLSYYYALLIQTGLSNLQLWETEYYQEMGDYQAIFDWVKGTGLRPVLANMDADNAAAFESKYIESLPSAYPIERNGKVLLPFRRVFMVGLKRAA